MPSRLIFLLYRASLLLAFPFILAYVAFRCAKNRAYWETLPERFGFLPHSLRPVAPGAIWVHAVSVGEIVSSVALVTRLRTAIPGCKIFISVSTLAGREIADKRLAGVADGIFYAPLDFVWVVRQVIRRLRPALLIVMETEIWPNLWREAKRAGAALLVLNGRISDKAMPRYEAWRWMFTPVLRLADRILVQTEISRDRYLTLGATPSAVAIGGNLKYDFDAARATAPEAVEKWVAAARPGPVWVAASTMPRAGDSTDEVDEDEAVLSVFERISQDIPGFRLILAPRRPERFDTAAAEMEKRGIAYLRRSAMTQSASSERVLLLDSMGELAGVFRLADIVFVGGTLCNRGGHNILEPAFFGRPVIVGPHMENFPEIAEDFRAAGACLTVPDTAGLEDALREAISSDSLRAQLGESAREQALCKTGATDRAVEVARILYDQALPRPFASVTLLALAALWRTGGRVKRALDLAAVETLPKPVISIGGIGIGGVGKTPLALTLAKLLGQSGISPAFLTRGYNRTSQEECSVIPAGGPASIEQTGDEAQLLVRSSLGPVGICSRRARAGRELLQRFTPDVFLLDDGFQHARLARSVDLVLIDTLDPFGGFQVVPAGRLREPLEALGRASGFVLMRCEAGRNYEGILSVLKQYNPPAPVFRSHLEPAGWVDAATGQSLDEPWGRGAAMCGLGNPAAFWRSLEIMNLQPAFRVAFPDHHRYHPRDLRRLGMQASQEGVDTLWTTEKDAMNLPPEWRWMNLPFRILALRVRAVVEEEERLVSWLRARAKLS